MMNAISIKAVTKEFKIGIKRKGSFVASFANVISGVSRTKKFLPLKNISLEIKKGEKVGVIGRNGAGKSTLLKLIAGIYKLEKGSIEVNGDLIILTNVSNGLKGRLTARDNIYLVGGILGLSKKEIDKLFEKIIEFSDLEDFVDTKVYQLSSGMKSRLAFSVTIHCLEFLDPDILLLDEVMSGRADVDYKEKSGKKIMDLIRGDKTAIIVSHSLDKLKEECSRIVWLHKGKIKMEGDPDKVTEAYENFHSK